MTNIKITIGPDEDISKAIRRFNDAMRRTGMRPDMLRGQGFQASGQKRSRKHHFARLRRARLRRIERQHYRRWLIRESLCDGETRRCCPPKRD